MECEKRKFYMNVLCRLWNAYLTEANVSVLGLEAVSETPCDLPISSWCTLPSRVCSKVVMVLS
jgi:hypothetical protein